VAATVRGGLTFKDVIDLHCHALPGIDDGPATSAGSLDLIRASVAAGVGTVLATPHVSWRYPNDAASIAAAVEDLRGHLESEGIEVQLLAGAEVAMTQIEEIEAEELARLGLGGGSWLLLEPPFSPVAPGLGRIVRDVQLAGMNVLLAHPERCPAFQRDPDTLRALVTDGVLTSLTAGSLVGRFGGSVRRFAVSLLRDGLAHNVASDAHDHSTRAPGIRAEIEQAGFGALTGWLTEEVPAAILAGGEIPPRPSGVRGGGSPLRRWRLPR
jgi:protein-tyrosine phosphatase